MRRQKDKVWDADHVGTMRYEQATLQVLQDLRDELKWIRRLLQCPNIQKGLVAMQVIEKRGRKRKVKK